MKRRFMDIAEQLNRAYSEDQQLSRLFRQHRLLALWPAPLASRIVVLRRIRAADPFNFVWQDDLQLLECARLQELSSEIRQANSSQNLDALLALAVEVNSPDWLQPPPAEIVQTANDCAARLKVQQARQMLEQMVQPLDEAYSAFDIDAGRAIRDQWQGVAKVAQLLPTDTLALRVAPALEWLADQDQRQDKAAQWHKAVFELEAALDTETPRIELERLYHAAMRFDEPLPVALEARLRSRFQEFDLKGRRRSRLLIASVLGLVALVGGATAYLLVRQSQLRDISEASQALAQLIDNGQRDSAERFLEEMETHLALASSVQEEKARLEQLRADERERLANFQRALGRARAAGPEHPDISALEQARRLAASESEHADVAVLEAAVYAAARAAQERKDGAFSERWKELPQRVLALEKSGEVEGEAETKILLVDIRWENRSS